VATYLSLLESLEGETSYSVWHSILQALITIDRLEQGQPGRAVYQAYVCSLLNPLLERLGWYPNNDEELATKLFRNELIETLSIFGDRSVINQAFERFEQMRKDPNSVTPDLRGAVVAVVGRYSSEKVYAELHELAHDATLLEAKDDYYHAMECALDPKLAEKTLEVAISEELSPAESASAFAKVASEGEHADLAWNFVKGRLDQLEKNQSQTLWTLLVPAIVEGMYDRETAEEILNLSKNRAKDNGLVRTQMAVDLLQARAKLRERLLPDIDDWVKKRAGTRVEAAPKSSAVTSTFITAAPSLRPVSTPGANTATPAPTPESTALKIVISPESKAPTVPGATPRVALISSTPTPTPEPAAAKIVVSAESKGMPEPEKTPEPTASPSASLVKSTSHLPLVPVPTPTPLPEPLSMTQSTPRPVQAVVPEPSPTLESTPKPNTTPVASPRPVESAAPKESQKVEESASAALRRDGDSSNIPPSPTASPEPSPVVQKHAIAKHSATPKPKPSPTPTPKPKTLIGKIFDNLRKANEVTSTPTPTPFVRVWASPTPKPKGGKASPSPTPRWMGKNWGHDQE
jgi:hypothetical protein